MFTLENAINQACEKFPDGLYEICIEIQEGWAGVKWFDQNGGSHDIEVYDGEPLSEQIRIALAQAQDVADGNSFE